MKIYKKLLAAFLLSAVVLLIFSGISCSLSPEGITLLTGDYTSPKLLSFDLSSENDGFLCFSREIKLESIRITENSTKEKIQVEKENLGSGIWKLNFKEALKCSSTYIIEGNVKDEKGNSLYFKDKFQGYNSRVPEIIINEIRSEYSKPKIEFVEFLVLSDGNIGGMQFISGADGEENAYIFPSIEVKKGEFIVLHFRKQEENQIDEKLQNLKLSEGSDSTDARDLWIDNNSARIGKNDVLLLKKRIKGEIADAVMFHESGVTEWKNSFTAQCAKEAVESGKWIGSESPESAAVSDGVTTTRTLCRINETNEKNSWIVVATSQATPGKENSKEKYVAK